MKKIYLLFMAFTFLSCSVEDEGIMPNENYLMDLSAVVEGTGCATDSYPFEDAGVIEVVNDEEVVYVTILANSGYVLNTVRLQVGDHLDDFPLTGNGNLPPGQMKINESFSSGVTQRTYEFPLSDYSDSVTIASISSFSGTAGNITAWAGDNHVQSGNWSYFEYMIQDCHKPCKEFDAGQNKSKTITSSKADEISGVDQARNLYLSLLDPGVNRNGTFDPSIWYLINDFKRSGVGAYTTTYTITEGDCSDSVELSMIVVPD
ncbi:hypothetical protein [Salinimicrobium flavum]|uniref:DUF5017 domain-containing protein n=1 Tax=Salinimicrobium flavum TaxID=1737065 RepID=A0ABW5IYL5_9FLAO